MHSFTMAWMNMASRSISFITNNIGIDMQPKQQLKGIEQISPIEDEYHGHHHLFYGRDGEHCKYLS